MGWVNVGFPSAKRWNLRAMGVVALAVVLAMVVPPAVPAMAGSEKVTVKADKKVRYDPATKVWTLEGNIVIMHGKTTIWASRAEVNVEAGTAVITGGVKLAHEDVTITGHALTARFREDKVVVTEGVSLIKGEAPPQSKAQDPGKIQGSSKAQAESSSDKGGAEELKLTCARLELNTATRDFVAEGDVTVQRSDTTAKAARAQYFAADKRVDLAGGVVAQHGDESLKCDKLVVYTDRDEIEGQGAVEISFTVDKGDR